MQLIDSHAHLYLKDFEEDLQDVVDRAKSSGLSKVYLPNIDLGTVDAMHQISDAYPDFFIPMIGYHPGSVNENFESEINQLFEGVDFSKYAAIGEIGIDLYWDTKFEEEQKLAFKRQVEIAKANDLPIVIHARDSFYEIFQILDDLNDEKLRGIFHCFTGSESQAKHILEYGGFYMGIGGIVTFKNAGLDQVLSKFDPKHFVLETDSPYLAPTPYRGRRNESAYLQYVAEKMAEIFEVSVEEIAEITTANCGEIYKR